MLRQAWEAAPNGEGTMRNQLVQFELQAGARVNAGTITGTSTSGRQVSLAPSRQGEKTLLETADTWTQLIDLWDDVVSILTAAGLAHDDQSTFNHMIDPNDQYCPAELRGITGYTSNFQYLSK